MVSRFFLLAFVAIAADLIIPAVYGANVRPAVLRHRELDLVGHGILSDMETGHLWKIKLTMLKDEDDTDDVPVSHGASHGMSHGIRRFYGPPPPTGFIATRG